MRTSRQVGVFFALALACVQATSQATRGRHLPLETALEAHSLPSEEAARAYPVHLRAVVTYYDPYIDSRHGALFVHDQTGSIFINLPKRPILLISAGDVVDVVGVTGAGDYAPVIDRGEVHVVGKSRVPSDAPRPAIAQLMSGKWDGQWVEVEGVVHAVHATATNVALDLATIGGPINATTLLEKGANYDSLVDSLVSIHGNAGPMFNRRRQLVGIHFFFPSLHEVKVKQAASADPYLIPALPVSRLLRFTPGLELAHRVHVIGAVTLQWAGLFCIQQAEGGLCMQNAHGDPVSLGDQVDVVGFPAVNEFKATLENAAFRVRRGNPSPQPAKTVTAAQAFKGDLDGELVTIEGTVIGQDRSTGNDTLIMRSREFLFLAVLPRDSNAPANPAWKDASLLRLTGICSVTVNSETASRNEGEVRPASVRILLRSVDDVRVLRAPSWWTTEHSLAVLAAVGTFSFVAFAWIVVLRRRVEQQTEALRKSEERLRFLSEHDALTNLPNRILLYDRLNMALMRAERFRAGLGLLMVDIDLFKEVNDTFGHHAGDRLLCELARRIGEAVRKTDTVARFGGDEFVILLPDLSGNQDAESIASKIVAAVSPTVDIGVAEVSVTVSIGICTYPEGGTDPERLLQSVDVAMYRAKAKGKNCFEVYHTAAQ